MMMRVAALILLCNFVIVGANAQTTWHQDAWPNTDFSQTDIDLNEVLGGGPPKDGIPSIDSPHFISNKKASKWVKPLEPVIVVEINGQARAYPLQILMYHEIANDIFQGVPISVTFCPLCNASIVFDRRVGSEVLDFGTTGLLRMSDLVMYDRQTESWWQQFSGKSIVGEWVGTELKRIPSSIVSFDAFRTGFPDGQVLSRKTGVFRPYGKNPYFGYDDIDQKPYGFDGKLDERLPPMERVISITVDGSNTIYPFSELKSSRLVNDIVGSAPVVVFAVGELLSALDDELIRNSRLLVEATAWQRQIPGRDDPLEFAVVDDQIVDRQTGSTWNVLGQAVNGPLQGTRLGSVDSGVHFAFAWLAFRPDSQIYGAAQ